MDEDWRNTFEILMYMEICNGTGVGICDGTGIGLCDGTGVGICDGAPSTCSSFLSFFG